MPRLAPIPLTVIGGFLGAGKTTLLNHLLKANSGIRYAVLVNDFGDLAIDEDLITSHDGKTIALANGCVCCTIGDNLVETLMELTQGALRPEHIIIEASGVADPRSIAELGSLDPNLNRDLTLVLVDGEAFFDQWADSRLRDTLERQLKAADVLVVNKAGDAKDVLAGLLSHLKSVAGEVPVLVTEDGSVPAALLAARQVPVEGSGLSDSGHDQHNHGALYEAVSLDLTGDVDLGLLKEALAGLPPEVLRVKGFVTADGRTFEVQKAGKRLRVRPAGPHSGESDNTLVLIGLAPLPALDELAKNGRMGSGLSINNR